MQRPEEKDPLKHTESQENCAENARWGPSSLSFFVEIAGGRVGGIGQDMAAGLPLTFNL